MAAPSRPGGSACPKTTVSHHLKTLREAGLFEYRMRGRNKETRLRREIVESRFPGLLAGILSEQAVAEGAAGVAPTI